MKNIKKSWNWVFLIIPPIIVLTLVLASDTILRLTEYVPACPFYTQFGKYCPACGNTRSITALLHGDILGSLRYNITIIFLCLLGLAFYVEKITNVLGKKIKLIPRGNVFLFASLAFFLMYFLLRNFFPYLTTAL